MAVEPVQLFNNYLLVCACREQSVENPVIFCSLTALLDSFKKKFFTSYESSFWFLFDPIKCKCSAAKVTFEDYEIEHHDIEWS